MSNPQQFISGVIGGVVGFFVGGPAGALYGLQIGLTVGTLLYPTQLPGVEGPRLTDFESIHADPGAPIYLGGVIEVSHTEEVGGKGGPEQEVTTFTYFQTLALGLCEGPITGLLRVWENGKLVYDVRDQLEDESDADYEARLEMSEVY